LQALFDRYLRKITLCAKIDQIQVLGKIFYYLLWEEAGLLGGTEILFSFPWPLASSIITWALAT